MLLFLSDHTSGSFDDAGLLHIFKSEISIILILVIDGSSVVWRLAWLLAVRLSTSVLGWQLDLILL